MKQTKLFQIEFSSAEDFPEIGASTLVVILHDRFPGLDIRVEWARGEVDREVDVIDSLTNAMFKDAGGG